MPDPSTRSKHAMCFVIDGLRASAIGAYGAAWSETPAFDRLACESMVFDSALADSIELNTLYDSYWHALSPLAAERTLDDRPTLPAVLNERDVATTLLTDDPTIAEHPLAADFDERVLFDPIGEPHSAASAAETSFAQFCAAAIECCDEIARDAETPHLLWLHARGLTAPWDAPAEFRHRLVDPDDPPPPDFIEPPCRLLPEDFDPDELLGVNIAYAAQISLIDYCVDVLWEHLRRTPLFGNSIAIVMGARGYPLGEHRRLGWIDHALYGETIHVPLLVRMPDETGALSRSPCLALPADLPATLADWFGVASPFNDGHSASWLPIVRGKNGHLRDVVCLSAGGEHAIRTHAWHLRLAEDAQPELFVKPDDRWEANEVSQHCGEIVEELERVLRQQVQAGKDGRFRPPEKIDPALVLPQ